MSRLRFPRRTFLTFPLLAAGQALARQAPQALARQAPQDGPARSDWPQWRGPDRSGRSPETGLLQSWPEAGPPVVWQALGLGGGYGSVSVAGSHVFLQMKVGNWSAVAALDRATGRLLWSRPIGSAGSNDRGDGPRGTPTVDGERVYALGESGDLACLRGNDGTPVWTRSLIDDFGGRNIRWLYSESPLVEDDRVYVTPGGRNGTVVALDKMSGERIWSSGRLVDAAGYSSLVAGVVGGVRTLVTMTAEAGVGIRASDGELLWRYTGVSNTTANIATPVFEEDRVFLTTSYGGGGALLALTASGSSVEATEIYHTRNMENHHGGVVAVDGFIYGFHNSILVCLDMDTGERMWRDRTVGKGALSYADGHLYILGENQRVGLVEANPRRYVEKGRFRIEDRGLSSWAHPAISGGRLFLRNQGAVTAYDIRG